MIPPHLVRLLSVILFLWGNQGIAQTIYFQQDFSAGGLPAGYTNTNPDKTQFNGIGGGASLPFAIVDNALEFDRQVDNTTKGYAVRTTDFSPASSSLYIQFRFRVLSSSQPGANAVKFYVGSGFSNSPAAPTNGQVYARFAIDIQNGTDFKMNPLPSGGGAANSVQTFSGWQTVTFVLNKASNLLQYLTPLGSLEQQPVDTYDLWVGSEKVFNDQAVLTASQTLTDFKLGFDDGVSKIQVDDFLIRDISGALPVTLLSFAAKPAGDRVQLNWSTTSEKDASHFIVERSDNLGEFTFVDQVSAKGTTDQRQYYGVVDHQPLPGNNYYRLRQVDRDGTFALSKPVSAVVESDKVVMDVYPNPVDPARIRIRLWNADEAIIELRTMSGQYIATRLQRRSDGADVISQQPLPPGLYLLELRANGQRRVVTVLVP